MSKRKLVIVSEHVVDCGKISCGSCRMKNRYHPDQCAAFGVYLSPYRNGWRRCQPCLDAEQPASAPLSLVLSVPKARG